jgi:F-box protein 9
MDDTYSELDAFRQKWRDEVSARAQGTAKPPSQGSSKHPRQSSQKLGLPTTKLSRSQEDGDDQEPQVVLSGDGPGRIDGDTVETSKPRSAEPQSALEYYEKAVEREIEGSLGNSLNLYRKAFRARVGLLVIHDNLLIWL